MILIDVIKYISLSWELAPVILFQLDLLSKCTTPITWVEVQIGKRHYHTLSQSLFLSILTIATNLLTDDNQSLSDRRPSSSNMQRGNFAALQRSRGRQQSLQSLRWATTKFLCTILQTHAGQTTANFAPNRDSKRRFIAFSAQLKHNFDSEEYSIYLDKLILVLIDFQFMSDCRPGCTSVSSHLFKTLRLKDAVCSLCFILHWTKEHDAPENWRYQTFLSRDNRSRAAGMSSTNQLCTKNDQTLRFCVEYRKLNAGPR